MNEHVLSTPRDRDLTIGTIVSVLLHALALVLLLVNLRFDAPAEKPKETVVEVVMLAPKPDAPPQKPPEPVQPTESEPAKQPRPTPRPPPPQLSEAPPAEHSKPPPAPPKPQAKAATGTESSGPGAGDAPPAPLAPKAERSRGGGAAAGTHAPSKGGKDKAAQDEKDFLLAQILPFWLLDYRNPRFHEVTFNGHFVLQEDGMLAPPFGKNDPWQPEVMIGGYRLLLRPEAEPQRTAIETFLRAVRAAQPFRLPPGVDKSKYPHPVPVFFRLGDL